MAKHFFSRKKRGKVVEKTERKDTKPVKGCKMILCEDPLTGDLRLFPVECPQGYVTKMKSRMREKGVKFSSDPLPENAVLSIPDEKDF